MKIDNKEEQIKVILSMGSSNRKRLLIFLVKIFLQKNDVRYTYYISLVEAIIRHQKLPLACREPAVALSLHVKIRENYQRSSHQRSSVKKVFLEIFQNSQGKTCARASF